jgi:Fe-S cluster assembly ATP-binding protein
LRRPAVTEHNGSCKLEIIDLHGGAAGKQILKGLNLTVPVGEIHALMGPNASGKSTLAHILLGKPGYEATRGAVRWDGEDILSLSPHERAARGMFLAFQYPLEIPGVRVADFLRLAYNQVKGKDLGAIEFRYLLAKKMKMLGMEASFAERYLNQGFSGGEKKRNEILQMAVLEPRMAILDETDSGLDIDALKAVSNGVNTLFQPDMGMVLITHYQRILSYIQPHRVHVMVDGRIVKSGGKELALELEAKGYEAFKPNGSDSPGK